MDFSELTDRELDAEVAKRMGADAEYPNRLRFYSSTWEGAGQVLEFCRENGHRMDLKVEWRYVVSCWSYKGRYAAIENRYGPRAICEAFCMAVPLERAVKEVDDE